MYVKEIFTTLYLIHGKFFFYLNQGGPKILQHPLE